MTVNDILGNLADVAADQPIMLLMVILAIGGAIGAVRVKGFALGPAAVLFTALAFSAFDDRLRVPQVLGTFGLAVFAYVIGLGAGPSFFATLRAGGRVLIVVFAALAVGAGCTVLVARGLGLSGPVLSGIYAGALTNTPALAAASEVWNSDLPTVGYSVTYLFGVLGMLAAAAISLRLGSTKAAPQLAPGDGVPPALTALTVRIEVAGLPDLGALSERYGHGVVFSRIMRGDVPAHPGEVSVATDGDQPVRGDIVSVVGAPESVERFVADVGHPSTVALTLDRSTIDYRRIAVSDRTVVGQSLASLRLRRRFGATATRVRRGDIDLLATDDLVLQLGDRVRVVAPRERMADVAAFLGDSEKGTSAFSITSLALGVTLGLLLGIIEFPLPGGSQFALGIAGGPLLVGLMAGRAGRTGPVLWTLPHAVSSTLSQLGIMMFLAYAGTNAGAAMVTTLSGPIGLQLVLVGVAVTTATAATILLAGPFAARITGPRLAGVLAGAQTQPAVLAYADEATASDSRVSLSYALVYPAAMIVKVIVAPILGRF
ncbi:MAG: transporter [Actinobacteria bacterium]|nr:transporter [Actinomycetota bacterium]